MAKIKRRKIVIYAGVLIFIILISYLGYWQSQRPGKYDGFAKCLTEKGFVMAGTDWCKYCKAQKASFGKSFKYVDYKNCDFDKAWCDAKGVEGYPTWLLPEGKKLTGKQPLERLGVMSGCEL